MAQPLKLNKPVIQVVPIEKLKEWERNPRKKHAVNLIANSIEAFGYLSPIIVQKGTFRILGGHGRLKALRSKKVTEVPVIIADVTDEQADAFTIADNKLTDLSQFDLADVGSLFTKMDKKLAQLTGFSDGEINELARISADVADAGGVGRDAKSATIYAGDEVDSVNTTMFVTFGTREQLKKVKAEIHRLQAGNGKSIGDVVFERFLPPQ